MASSSNSGSVHNDQRRSSIEDHPGDAYTNTSDLIEPIVGIERVSPNSGRKSYIPAVSDSFKPNTYMSFFNLNEAYDFYVRYAKEGGFGVRKGKEYHLKGVCRIKQYVCSKSGFKPKTPFDNLNDSNRDSNEGKQKMKQNRRRASQRTGCNAQLCLRINEKTQKYDVYKFIKDHNHPLVGSADINFLAAYRKLNYSQMQNMYSFSQHIISTARAFSIMRTMYGGFENIGATKEDMKNFKRRLNLTDQDPAMKQAIQTIFPNSRHRFCMWHIMKKVADKVGPVLSSNESFKQRICDIVWTDSITPEGLKWSGFESFMISIF